MSLPPFERANPRDLATAATVSGRFHDVVLSASKVIHGTALESRDQDALKWAGELLDAAGSRDVIFAMPSSQQLANSGGVALALRRAAQPDHGDPGDELADLRRAVDAVLRGGRDQTAIDAMETLRALFSVVSRVSLQAEVHTQSQLGRPRLWSLSTTTSTS